MFDLDLIILFVPQLFISKSKSIFLIDYGKSDDLGCFGVKFVNTLPQLCLSKILCHLPELSGRSYEKLLNIDNKHIVLYLWPFFALKFYFIWLIQNIVLFDTHKDISTLLSSPHTDFQ